MRTETELSADPAHQVERAVAVEVGRLDRIVRAPVVMIVAVAKVPSPWPW